MIGKNLVTLRKKEGKTKKEVAIDLKIHESTYGKYELGHREPDINTIQNLARYYNVTIDYLLGEAETTNVPTPLTTDEFLAQQGIKKEHHIEAIKKIIDMAAENESHGKSDSEFSDMETFSGFSLKRNSTS